MRNMQVVILELDNGRRGVFVGPAIAGEREQAEACQVENIWLSNIGDLPDDTDLAELTRLALAQLEAKRHLH